MDYVAANVSTTLHEATTRTHKRTPIPTTTTTEGIAVAVAAAIPVLAPLAAVVVAVLTGSYMQSRIASLRGDAETRRQHWAEVVGMMNDDSLTTLFGMGLGSFPLTYLLKNPRGVVPATFRYVP